MKIQIVIATDTQAPDWVSVLAANGNDVALCEQNQAAALNLNAQTVVLLLAPLDELVKLAKVFVAQQARVYILAAVEAIDPLRQRHLLEAIAEDVGAGFIDLAAQQKLTQDRSLQGLVQYLMQRIQPPFQPVDYYFGASTYPEVWDEAVMYHDIAEMKKLGMNLTRIGEFSWRAIEPSPGNYRFSWLEKSLQAFEEAGIAVLLGIPTPTPPRWLTAGHPERCVVDDTGQIMVHGSRQHVCLNNATFVGMPYK